MEYGIQTHNKFAFLDDDVDVSDPEEALAKKVEEAKKLAVSTALAAKKSTVPSNVTKPMAQKENDKPIVSPNVDATRTQAVRTKGTSYNGQPEQKTAPTKANRSKPTYTQTSRTKGDSYNGQLDPKVEDTKKVSVSDGSRRKTPWRKPRGEQSAATRPRQSEPDPKESENNEGGWDTNVGWDTEKVPEDTEKPKNEENVEDNSAVEEAKEPEAEIEQVPREKTYEEWKNEQQQKNAEQIHFNTRKPGEGDDQKLYKKLIPVKNPSVKESKHGNEFDESAQHKEKREKALLIDLSFSDKRSGSSRGVSGFGDRGSGTRGDRSRGGGNRAGHRGGPPRNNFGGGGSHAGPSKRQQDGSFMLENEQFPALGAAH